MTWLVLFAWVWVSQILQISSSVLNRPENENEKNERKRATQETEFSYVRWLGKEYSNKVFIECQRLFFCQQKKDMMQWPRGRLCNVIEIKNNEMIQLFLVERSCNQWFLSKKVFCIRRFRKKMFSEIWPQSQASQSKFTGRKVGSVKQHGGFQRLKRWLKSLTKINYKYILIKLKT